MISFRFNPFTNTFDAISTITLTSVGSTPNASGASLSAGQALTLQPASASFPGLVSTGAQAFAGSKTFGSLINADGGIDRSTTGTLTIGATNSTTINIGNSGATVNIQGTTIYENTPQLLVADPLITVNSGGGAGSGQNSGIQVEEAASITGYAQTSSDRNSWLLKAPNTAGIATVTPGASGITLDQSSHNPVTLGTANGLSLSTQVLSLALSSTSTTGALSSTDWNTFNNKGSGSVTSVAATVPAFLSVAGSPITTSGTLAITLSGTALPVTSGGTGTNTAFTSGSVVVADGAGVYAQDNANLFYDFTNARLGVGTNTPASRLAIADAAAKTASYTSTSISATNTSSTASIAKVGLSVASTGTWNGSSATNTGLAVSVSGGTTNYSATFIGGNVGIGTTTPPSRLAITNTAAADVSLLLTGAISQSGDYLQVKDSSSNTLMNFTAGGALQIGKTGDAGARLLVTGGASGTALITLNRPTVAQYSWALAGGGLSFSDDTAGAIVTNLFGNAGLNESVIGQKFKTTADTRDSYLSAQSYGPGAGTDYAGRTFYISGGAGTGAAATPSIEFKTADATTSGTTPQSLTTKMAITGVGRVGIGTTSPSVPLDVNGAARVRGLTTAGPVQTDASGNLSSSASLPVANGGTGQTSYTDGQLLIGNTTGNTLSKSTLTAGTGISITNGAGAITVATTFTAPTVQVFTSGSGTYTTPAGVRYIVVEAIGGGGGGAGSGTSAGTAATAGGTTTFGSSLISCTGGSAGVFGIAGAGGGAGSLGSAVGHTISGGGGGGSGLDCYSSGAKGGDGAFGGGASGGAPGGGGSPGQTNTGGGGGGASSAPGGVYGGAGGGAGGYAKGIISSPSATYSYAVGAGGSAGGAGASGMAGGTGGSGKIVVWEYYQ